jgi:polysaccharide pyruvyl transferase WcaK-like protein
MHKESHYASLYFHNARPAVDAAYKKYLGAIAGAVNSFRAKHNVFPIVVAMERLDTKACEALAPQIGGAPIFTSDSFDMYAMVSILRCCSLMVSSRYHAMVTSMPGLVPSAGITMDERIRNLLRDRGHDHLLLTVDDPDLESKLLPVLETLVKNADSIRDGMARSVVRNLKTMARMGVFLERAVHERYPEFPVRTGVHSWEDYLPPLSRNLDQLLNNYEGAAAAAAGD